MEFIVTRTSLDNIGSKERPCWEATPKTISYNFMGQHREESVWVVNFHGLKDIINFKKKYGAVIIGSRDYGLYDSELFSCDTIEIYDRWRE